MAGIHPLSEILIAHIAAGEVIERPGYAVKELIENAIDAQASRIIISLENSGLKKIVVSDDGMGMTKNDLVESYKLHTTSKIANISDLREISSLGFRGEALASIAAISSLTIESRTTNDTFGTRILVLDGVLQSVSETGMPKGTTVTVQNIFSKVPARKKFMKSPISELRFIIDLVTKEALSHPEIEFMLIHNKKPLLDFSTCGFNYRIIQEIKNTDMYIPIDFQDSYVQIKGFIGKPQISTSTQSKQFLIVNGRVVSDKGISQKIKQSFGNLLEATHHPPFILFIDLPVDLIDVNVHPRKEQIHFLNSESIYTTLEQIIKNVLKEYNLAFQLYDLKGKGQSTKSFAANYLKQQSVSDPLLGKDIQEDYHIKQIHNLYLVIETKKGMTLVDQHAAHERILYQKYLKEFQSQSLQHQRSPLEKPYLIELQPADNLFFLEYKDQFLQLGFVIEEFGERTYQITAVPFLMKDRNPIEVIIEMLSDIKEEGRIKNVDEQNEKMLEYLACRSAIKSGDELTEEQALKLFEELENTENNATCPHGRPTKIEMNLHELHRMFKRV